MITSVVAIPARLDTHHIFSVDKFYWEGSQTRPHFTLRLRELRCRAYRSVPLGKDTTKPAQTKALAVSFLLANAHVASCGWLGIHEVALQASGFGVKS